MQRIINNILYDTETATLLYRETPKNVSYYMTPVHGYFFAVYANGEFIPLTEEFMKDFLGQYDINKYIEIFGEPQEG